MPRHYTATVDGADHEVEIEELNGHTYRVSFAGKAFQVDTRRVGDSCFSIFVGSRSFDLEVSRDDDQLIVASRRGASRVTLVDKRARPASAGRSPQVGRAELKAMMPGRVVAVLVAVGDEVKADQGVLVVEAMKMENEIKAPKAGRVIELKATVGQTVEKGALLLVIE
ncbi:MAG TPA: biotin/lipoyl-containing protein [Candidatus Binataceae bacterium]